MVDNGSREDGELATGHPAVSRVVTGSRPGSYAARNAALAVASGDVIAFTDADCIPAPDWLLSGVTAVAEGGADPIAGQVVPRRSSAPTVWDRFDAGHHVDQRNYVEMLGFGATANLFVRRAVLDDVGHFDGAMGSGGDRELCRRAVAAGYRLAYLERAAVSHGPRAPQRDVAPAPAARRRLRELHARGLQPAWWRDDQMLLPLGWAAEVAGDATRRYRHREMLPLAAVVVTARAVGRITGR